MRVSELFLDFAEHALPDAEILTVTQNASLADRHSVFVCIKGARHDGHAFASVAYQNGCRYFVAERSLDVGDDAHVLLCQDTRQALGLLACRFYGDPSHRMRLVGITGTKGKTTTALLLSHLLEQCGIPCGYVGTNGVRYRSVAYKTPNTTPDALTLQKALYDMLAAGVSTAVVEVSSQALLCHRTAGTVFDTVLFTNLSPDHIGPCEHPDMENYKVCKKRLFTDYGAKTAIVNADDPVSAEMLADTTADTCITVSLQKPADLSASRIALERSKTSLGVSFVASDNHCDCPVSLALIGKMNVENALMALATARYSFGIDLSEAANALQNAKADGRSEVYVLPNGASAVIDYAHNGASLRQLLLSLREYQPRRLTVLFGSVGERTKQRRYELGRVAAELCDLCILTSDNPANEDPEAIIDDIAAAFAESNTPYLKIPDRKAAIETAIAQTQDGDILVLAGKGHEEYQLIGNEKRPFSEKEILFKAASNMVCDTI